MRLASIAAVAVLAFSTMALAQVARAPVERKVAPAGAAAPANGTLANTASSDDDTAAGNDTGMPANAKTEPAAPPR